MKSPFTLCVFCTDNLINTLLLKKKNISEVLYSAKDIMLKPECLSAVKEPDFLNKEISRFCA